MADIVGLAIQGRIIRAVEVKIGRKGRHEVLRSGEISIPESTFEEGLLTEPAVFAEHLKKLWSESGFKSKQVRLVIDGRLAVIRRTELPSVQHAKLRQAAAYDIAELLNYPIDEALFGVDEIEPFERGGVQWARALVVAVRASAVEQLKTAIASAGLRLAATELAAEALSRSVHFDRRDGGESDVPIAIVDCEDSVTNVAVRDASGVLFARTLNVGVGETTISMADELESALAQLSGTDSDSATGDGQVTVGVSNVVEGIRRTLGYYTSELDQRPIREVAVAGARGQVPGLVASLENTLAIPCSGARSTAVWSSGESSAGYELPLGAALGAAPSNTRRLVLTSDRERAATSRRRQRLAAIGVSVPVAVVLAATTLGLRATSSDVRSDAERAESATATLALRVAELEETTERVATWNAAAADVRSIESQRVGLALVVRELAASMPGDVRLVNIQLDGVIGSDVPIGYTGPTPDGVVSISGVADDLDGVGRWLAAANATETIEGLWLEQSTFGPIGADGENGVIFSVKGAITSSARPADTLVTADDASTTTGREAGR